MAQQDHTHDHEGLDPGTRMACHRTAMSFTRTDFASNRTLMAVARTSLSFIGFGFTIFNFFNSVNENYLGGALPPGAPARFGLTLVGLGVILLVFGIANRRQQVQELRARRIELIEAGLLEHPMSGLPSSAMVISILLLLVGLFAILSIAFRIGPF